MIRGRCLCEQVSYESAADPIATVVCHCRNCQKQAGSAFSIVVAVPSETVIVTGILKTYEDRGDGGGIVRRQFCPECGSPIFSLAEEIPGITIIKAGTLDDPSGLAPQMQVWCRSAQPWVRLDPELPQFAQTPPAN